MAGGNACRRLAALAAEAPCAWLLTCRVEFGGTDVPVDLSAPLITRKDAAKVIGKSTAWFEKNAYAFPEKLPPAYRLGNLWRYSRGELLAWLDLHAE